MGLGVALVVGPPRASWPASSDPPSPCSYLTDASPSPPPVRPKNCRTRPSTVTMTVAWRNLRRHPASHPRDPRLGPLALPEDHYERTTPDGSIGEMEHPENGEELQHGQGTPGMGG